MRIVILLALIWLLPGCQVAPTVLKVGVVAPFSGKQRTLGYDVFYAARLAVQQVNSEGGIGGRKIALVALDDRSSPAMARQAAASLVVDPDVVVVIGHWLPDTTAAAEPVYRQGGLHLLPAGGAPLDAVEPRLLPTSFLEGYEAITPYDEVAGAYAGSAYDAMGLVFEAMGSVEEISRQSLARRLPEMQIQGITGTVYHP